MTFENRENPSSCEQFDVASISTVNKILEDIKRKTKPVFDASPDSDTPLVSPDFSDTGVGIAFLQPATRTGLVAIVRTEDLINEEVVRESEIEDEISIARKRYCNKDLSIYYISLTNEGPIIERWGAIINESDRIIAKTEDLTVSEVTVLHGLREAVGRPGAKPKLGPNGHPLVSEFAAQKLLERIEPLVPSPIGRVPEPEPFTASDL